MIQSKNLCLGDSFKAEEESLYRELRFKCTLFLHMCFIAPMTTIPTIYYQLGRLQLTVLVASMLTNN